MTCLFENTWLNELLGWLRHGHLLDLSNLLHLLDLSLLNRSSGLLNNWLSDDLLNLSSLLDRSNVSLLLRLNGNSLGSLLDRLDWLLNNRISGRSG